MSLEATVTDPLTDPVPAGWDGFVAAQRLLPVWCPAVFGAVDWCAQAASSAVLVREAGSGQPVALFHARHAGLARLDRFTRPGRIPPVGVTECRIHPAVSPGLVFADALDARDRAEAVRVFERALRRRCGAGYPALGYRYLPEQLLPAVPAGGRARIPLGPGMVIHNEWPDLAGYLASLPRKWRSQLKKIRATVQAGDLRVGVADAVDPDEAGWLVEVVRRRHRSVAAPLPPWPARLYAALGRSAGCRFVTYREGQGRLVGHTIVFDDGRELVPVVWGTRGRGDGGHRDLYFDQYLRLVELMLQLGRHRLQLGPGMAAIKTRYGARPEPRWAVVGRR